MHCSFLQYDCFREEGRLEYLRKWIVGQKLESQIQLFNDIIAGKYRHLLSDKETSNKFRVTIAKMRHQLQSLEHVHDPKAILHAESFY
jgi:hypothetical protein